MTDALDDLDDVIVVALPDDDEDEPVAVVVEPHALEGVTVVAIDETDDSGENGLDFFSGDGPPDVVVGAGRGDLYLDTTSGQLYRLT